MRLISRKNVSPVTYQRLFRLYTATVMNVARQRQIVNSDNRMQRKDSMDTPLAKTNISMTLSLVRKECEKLLTEDQTELTLELEETDTQGRSDSDDFNPYDTGPYAFGK